jgi:hypothetical protein
MTEQAQTSSILQKEIAAFEQRKSELEAHHLGKWALFRGLELIGTFDNFENAAAEAVARFGAGPYLIRQVGAPPMTLPASVMYRPIHAKN